ncbi:MAG: trigger factor [Anaerolineales bacterium]|nr:trigger factor [Anaerolineales bacterium]
MKIETEARQDHQIKLHVEMEAEPLESAKRRAARQIAKKVKIPGFRPGKAPYAVIARHVGEAAIIEDAIDILINEQYPQIIEQAEIQPYGPGQLEEIVSLDPPTFDFIVPLEPVIELGDYKTIEMPYEPPEVDAGQVEAVLENMREEHVIRESVDRPAQPGDMVFSRISLKNTAAEDETEAMIYDGRFSSNLVPAEGVEPETDWPYPGFSKELAGLSNEESKTLSYTFPEDYKDEKLQGVPAEIEVIVTNVQARNLPELDDEFAKTASDLDTLEELRQNILADLEAQADQEYAQSYDDQVIDALVEISKLAYPPQMVEQEQKDMLSSLEYNLSRQGISMELYLQIRGLDQDGLLEEVRPIAETRLKRSLVLLEVAKAEELKVDEKRLAQEAGRAYTSLTREMSPKELKEFQQSNYMYNVMNSITADLITEKTMNFLRALAKGEPWEPEVEAPESEPEQVAAEQPEAEAAVEPETTPAGETAAENEESAIQAGEATVAETDEEPEA